MNNDRLSKAKEGVPWEAEYINIMGEQIAIKD